MTNILVLTASATGEASVSNQLVEATVERLGNGATITRRNLDAAPLPHLTGDRLGGVFGGTDELTNTVTEELKAADLLIIGTPMYNFGLPTVLKAWFDHVLRVGVTFHYTAEGPKGLLQGKRAIVLSARGGVYSSGPAAAMDFQESHIRAMLGFIGITDVTVVRAEGVAMGDDARQAAFADARAAIAALSA